MLSQIQHYLENPEDIPPIPKATAEYLQARLNHSYLLRTGVLDDLRRGGMSEAAILGFIEGAAAAVEIIELMEQAQVHRLEEQQVT